MSAFEPRAFAASLAAFNACHGLRLIISHAFHLPEALDEGALYTPICGVDLLRLAPQ